MHRIKTFLRTLLLALCLCAAPLGAQSLEETAPRSLPQQIDSLLCDSLFLRTQLGLYIYDLTADSALYAHNIHQQMRPASTQKLVTGIVALAQLGTDYRYRTTLYCSGHVADSVLHGSLAVRGGFDPHFDRDDLAAFVRAVSRRGIRRIEGDLLLDVSLKDTLRLGWGWCWDDKNPVLTPLPYEREDHFARAFVSALARKGIQLCGTVRQTLLPAGMEQMAVRSRGIDEILLAMMKDSDNFFAESLFYHLAAQRGKPFAEQKDAARRIRETLSSLGIADDCYRAADGSGLSPYNYLTPEVLVWLLRFAHQREDIFRHLQPALAVAGEDGTLRRRMRNTPAAGNVFAKTGTLTGVSSLAGYARAANGHWLCFAIINQGQRRAATATAFQNRVCEIMTQPLAAE